MSKYEYLSNTQLSEALRQYLAFLESRGLSSRTEEVPVTEALGRISACAAYARRSLGGLFGVFRNATAAGV